MKRPPILPCAVLITSASSFLYGISMERLSTSVCLHNRLVSFAKKSLAEYLTHVFKFFRHLKNFSSKSEIYFKWIERIVESSPT